MMTPTEVKRMLEQINAQFATDLKRIEELEKRVAVLEEKRKPGRPKAA